jgi:hypothetical protein
MKAGQRFGNKQQIMRPRFKSLIAGAVISIVLGCDASQDSPGEAQFRHDVPGALASSTDENFDTADNKFTFRPAELRLTATGVPAKPGSMGPRLSSGPASELLLSWMEPGDDGTSLQFAHWESDAWRGPHTVVEDAGMFVNWTDLPSVAPIGDDRLAAHWMRRSPVESHAHDVLVTQSFDGGQSWLPPVKPHTDGTASEHGLVSLFAQGDEVGILWLDGRKQVNEVTDDPVASAMTLRAARLDQQQQLHGEQLVDEMVCDCCQIGAAKTRNGYIAAYRDRSVEEFRDIVISSFENDRWQPGRSVHADGWQILACPFNGPSVAVREQTVAVAWFTAVPSAAIKLAISDDAGTNFAAPVIVAETDVLGRVTAEFIDGVSVAVSWLKSTEAGYSVNVRRVSLNGSFGPVRTITDSAAGLSVPQMARSNGSMVFVWTEDGDNGESIASASAPLDTL